MSTAASRFLTKFTGTQIGRRNWRLHEPLILQDAEHGLMPVPAGYITNLASIEMLRWVSPVLFALLAGYGNASSAVHDLLYDTRGRFGDRVFTRKQSDQIFYRALRAEGVARWRAAIFYAGVRLFGGFWWNDTDSNAQNASIA